MASVSDTADALLQSAWAAFSQDNAAAAQAYGRQALQLEPTHIGALGALGFFLHSAGRFAEAEDTFARLTDLDPSIPEYWMNLGTARRCAGRLDEALAAYTRAAGLGANSADFLFNVGLAHIDRKDFESGRAVLSQAVALVPEDAEMRYQYASCCYELLRTEEALAALEPLEQLPGVGQEIVAGVGLLLLKLGAVERAEPVIRRALAAAGGDPKPLLTLIQLLERTNRLDEAALRMRDLDANPRAYTMGGELRLMKAQLAQRASDHETACTLFAELLDECKEFEFKHLLQFPLAVSLDALHRYEEAFDMMAGAHRSQTALLNMTSPGVSVRGIPTMAITRYGCDPADVAAWTDPTAPALEHSPVFIVAFPRSGTTLLELTLDSHPLLVSMDEQPLVQNALDDMVTQGASYPERLRDLDTRQLDAVRANYWERARRKVALTQGQRLVDKNPLNILRLPAIRRLFPHAPILLAVRHPCDVMISCFMQHFRTPDFAMLCSELEALATGYRRTFDFWYAQHELLRPRCMELRYETFIGDFHAQMRAVLDFLAVPWDEAVLRPQETARDKRFISTPSYSQVIEPVHNKAVGRWHHYERHFAGMLPIIAPYLERWGYEATGFSNNR